MLRAKPRFQTHIGHVFEHIARDHARRLVERGDLPEDLVVARWRASSREPREVDVLGLCGKRTHLLGEAKWQPKPVEMNDVERLRRKILRVPKPVDEPTYSLWTRAGATKAVHASEARIFDVTAMLE